MQVAVKIRNLVKCFEFNEVIKGCNITVQQGTIYGFLGANGAGKTTVFKLLTWLLIPEAGSDEILGANMLKHRDLILSKIGSLIDVPIFYEHPSFWRF